MAPLVALSDWKVFLGIAGTGEDAVLTPILAGVEAMLLAQCGRQLVPFSAAQTGRVETRDGSGSSYLFLDYPIAAVTSVVVDGDPVVSPDFSFTVGRRRLTRLDGGWFGWYGDPGIVVVTYNAQADLPSDAAVAVLRVATALYRQRGSEDTTDEREGPYGASYVKVAEDDPVWRMAVGTQTRVHV